MNDEKFHYIVKTLSRTKRKDYENYVLNAIWNRLGNLNIKPVSQQFIQNKDKSHYFIDLYFPQLNIGIECDEAHHHKKKERDKLREVTISDILFQVGDKNQYQPLHVDVTKPWNEIETQINFCVKQIQEKWEKKKLEGTLKEWKNESIDEFLKDSDSIRVGHDFSFNKSVDVLNYLFGKQYKGWQKAICKLDDSTVVWFPKLATETERQGHWNNVLSVDGKFIYETSSENISPSDLKNMVIRESRREPPKEFINRHTFAKVINPVTGRKSYKYIGTFNECGSIDQHIRIYERVLEGINLSV